MIEWVPSPLFILLSYPTELHKNLLSWMLNRNANCLHVCKQFHRPGYVVTQLRLCLPSPLNFTVWPLWVLQRINKVSVAFCLWRTWWWPTGFSCPVPCPLFYWELLLRKIMKTFILQQRLCDSLSESRHSSPHPASPFRAVLLWNAGLTHLAHVHSTMDVLARKWCLLRCCRDCEKEPVSELSWKANL